LDGVEVHYPSFLYPPKVLHEHYGWFYWRSVRGTLRRLVAEQVPDAILSYWVHPDGEAGVRLARSLGIPSAVIVGGSDVLLITHRPGRRRRVADVLRATDAVITVNHHLRERVLELGARPERAHVWQQGIDAGLFSPGDRREARLRLGIPAEARTIVWVGRMVPVKGLDVLLDACAILRRGLDFRLYLVGDGPLRRSLEAGSAARGLSEVVSFVGPRDHDQLADWYRAADLAVLPSWSEGLPNVLREALACGTPFVASRVGGIPEIAGEGDSRLVEPGDPSALAGAIAGGLDEWGSARRPHSRSTGWDESAEALIRILRSAVPASGATKRAGPMPSCPVAERRHAPNPWRQLLRRGLAVTLPRHVLMTGGPTSGRSVCLTFDDGPHPEYTPRLLDVLKERDVCATFFVIGSQAERHPEIVRRAVEEGHAVGNHTFSHGDPSATPTRRLIEEVRRTDDLLRRLTGRAPRLFRPPHGKVTAEKLWRLWRDGQTVVLWNADPKDYSRRDPDEVRAWFRERPLRGGDLVLMHDNVPHAIDVLPTLIDEARAAGLQFTTPPRWIDATP
jgi:peptidoglycan/xylan/chitin deacetylase (PgdA/CDA1 family)/glycosyltransferase involved in cell wall biosynthesis